MVSAKPIFGMLPLVEAETALGSLVVRNHSRVGVRKLLKVNIGGKVFSAKSGSGITIGDGARVLESYISLRQVAYVPRASHLEMGEYLGKAGNVPMAGAQDLFRLLCLLTPTSFGSEFIRKAWARGPVQRQQAWRRVSGRWGGPGGLEHR